MTRCALIILMLNGLALAQTAPPDSVPVKLWKHSLVGALNLNQVNFSNWAQGGENAISWAALVDGKSSYEKPKLDLVHTYKMAYGRTKLGDQGMRKTDDRIELDLEATRKLSGHLSPYLAATLKTQFDRGYAYTSEGVATAVSDFFDPGYLTQAVGVRYEPHKHFKSRLGVGLREVLTNRFNLYSDDRNTAEVEKSLAQGGLESVTNIDLKLAENMLFTSTLELFDAFSQMDQVVVRNNNNLAIKASKWVTVILNLQLIQEKRITPRTQMKESLAIGFSYTFL